MPYQEQAVDSTEPVSDTVWELNANQQIYGVVTGCALSLDGANMTLDIAIGAVVHDGTVLPVVQANNTETLVSDSSNPRFTWIAINSSGTTDIVSGTAAADPAVPELGDRVAISLIRIPANETIASNCTEIVKRIPLRTSPVIAEGPVIPVPAVGMAATSTVQHNVNTTAHVGLFSVTHPVTVNSLTFFAQGVGSAGTIAWGIFSNDGQNRIANETTASISGAGNHTDALAAVVTLPPGMYYFMFVSVGSANITLISWSATAPMDAAGPSGENETSGTVTVSAGTIPSSFDPDADITFFSTNCIVIRLN